MKTSVSWVGDDFPLNPVSNFGKVALKNSPQVPSPKLPFPEILTCIQSGLSLIYILPFPLLITFVFNKHVLYNPQLRVSQNPHLAVWVPYLKAERHSGHGFRSYHD
jgi:hypothetical protein